LKIFKVEDGQYGQLTIKEYQHVPEDYTLAESEFLTFLEAKQCLVSHSGHVYSEAYEHFQQALLFDEENCAVCSFLEENSNVIELAKKTP
jgi:hypothetical protein